MRQHAIDLLERTSTHLPFRTTRTMTQRQRLWLIALFTLLFIVLLIIGSILIVRGQTAFAVIAFLLAFVSVGGQMTSLAAWIKHRSQP